MGDIPALVLARLGVGITIRIVSEFAERPGAEHITESWHGEVEDGVRVLFKTVSQRGFALQANLTSQPDTI